MRKLVWLVLLLAVFVAVFRQRIFLRDPLGRVERSGAVQSGARVYINYSNDVLLEDAATHGFVVVQGWSKAPGVPQQLKCVSGMACWTDADRATVLPLSGAAQATPAVMSPKEVTFTDSDGTRIRVALR
ncbi:MAG: hypothetical protein M3Y50_18325 [Acidobacteriota bacterium]|nr:hypothetical protein [Acidobacteriota bacterium]